MATKQPLVFILINNWNGWQDTLACLSSLYKIDYARFYIILVDNASRDTSRENIIEWCEKNQVQWNRISYKYGTSYSTFSEKYHSSIGRERNVTLICCDYNIGFTGANNLSIAVALRARADYILLLNNDTEVAQDFLSKMVKTAEETERHALVGCKILFHSPSNIIWHIGGYTNFWGSSIAFKQGERDVPKRIRGVSKTHVISGAAMLISRDIINVIGVQDDRYFFAIDDIEYSSRTENAGFGLKINLDSVVWHKVSRAMRNKKPLSLYYQIRNTLLWRSEYFTCYQNLLFLFYYVPRWTIEFVVRLLKGRWQSSHAMLTGVIDFFYHRYGECPHLWLNPEYRRAFVNY